MKKYASRIAAMAESAAVVKGIFGALGDPDLISLGKFALPGAGISALVLLFFFIRKAPLSRIYYFHLFSFAFLCICLLFA